VGVRETVTAACVQVEPVIFDRSGTIERVAERTAEAAAAGASLVVFPETFVPAYPSSAWAKALAGWSEPGAKEAFALLHRESLEVPGPDADRLAEIAGEHGVWLVVGVNELDPGRPGTLYNSLLYWSPEGELALHHRKLVPTNHERLVWGPGDGRGLRAIETPLGRMGGLICWEN
jgi:nitrilase